MEEFPSEDEEEKKHHLLPAAKFAEDEEEKTPHLLPAAKTEEENAEVPNEQRKRVRVDESLDGIPDDLEGVWEDGVHHYPNLTNEFRQEELSEPMQSTSFQAGLQFAAVCF